MILILSSIAGVTFLAAKMKKANYSTATISAVIASVIVILALIIRLLMPTVLAAFSEVLNSLNALM